MLHEVLKQYLDGIERVVRQPAGTYVERYVEEILTPDRVNLRVRLMAFHASRRPRIRAKG